MKGIIVVLFMSSFVMGLEVQAGATLANTFYGDGHGMFGRAIDYKDGLLVVGDRWADYEGKDRAGLVYIYEYVQDPETGESTMQRTATLHASDGRHHDYFGTDVATDNGNMILVGAMGHDSKGYEAGAAYLFQRGEDGVWRETRKFEPVISLHNDPVMDYFGYSVDVTNGAALVGAPHANSIYTGAARAGGYYLYTYENGAWKTDLHVGGFYEDEDVGFSVSITNHFGEDRIYNKERYIVAAGAPGYNDDSGRVYVSVFGEVYGATPRWATRQFSGDAHASHAARFGYSVSARTDLLAVGAPHHTNNFQHEGKVVLYRLVRTLPHYAHVTMSAERTYLAMDEQDNYAGAYRHVFGSSVKLDADSDDDYTGSWQLTVGAPTAGGGVVDNAVYGIRDGGLPERVRITSSSDFFGQDVDRTYFGGIFVGDREAVHPEEGETGAVFFYEED